MWRALGRRPSVPAGDPGGLLWARFFVGGLRMAQCMVKLATGPESLAIFLPSKPNSYILIEFPTRFAGLD